MEINVAVLADAATADTGKLNILGIFDAIHVKQFPAVHPQCVLVFKINFQEKDKKPESFKIVFTDRNEKIFLDTVELPINNKIKEGNITLRVVLQNLKLPEPGYYTIKLFADSKLIKTLVLQAKKILPKEV